MIPRPSAGPRADNRDAFVASKQVSRLLRQSLLGLLAILVFSLPLSLSTPAMHLTRAALVTVHTLGTAGVCLALSLSVRLQQATVHLTRAALVTVHTLGTAG